MTWDRTYTDEQLLEAITVSTSWRGSLRNLGLTATSAGAIRSVRARADRLGIDYGHFRGQRGWTEASLRVAIATAGTWAEVVELLGLRDQSAIATIRGHTARLGLDAAHLTVMPFAATEASGRPEIAHLARAGSLLAAAWYKLCGHGVSWPLEPSRYDLLVHVDSEIRRVQVKTTTARAGATWKVYLSTSRRGRRTYDPEEIDDFFVIDGDFNYHLIPIAAVGGLHAIHLAAYAQYRLDVRPRTTP